ncbi:MAG: hypothetical protein EAZ07_09260 [Cytophagales bacterium]|nr:MAG: hypothetical protein EAZ07_09260 [Cytophagales bacterium]
MLSKKVDYLLAIKGNQGDMFEQIKDRFEKQTPYSIHTMQDLGHGRIEKRVCKIINDLKFIDDAQKWQGIKAIVKIEAERIDKKTLVASSESHY